MQQDSIYTKDLRMNLGEFLIVIGAVGIISTLFIGVVRLIDYEEKKDYNRFSSAE